MNIFRGFLLGNEEQQKVESPSKEEDNHSLVPSEAGSSSMREPSSGVGSPQSEGDCVIEILSSDDDEGSDDDDGKENAELSETIAVSAVVTTVKPTSPSPIESTKSLSVTATDSSNDFDEEDGDEKENSAGTSKMIDTTSSDASPKDEQNASKLGNTTETTNRSDSPVESTQSVNSKSKLFLARKRRRKRARDSQHSDFPTALLSSSSSNSNRSTSRQPVKRQKDPPQKSYSISPSLNNTASKEGNEENPFDFPGEEQSDNEHQAANKKREVTKVRKIRALPTASNRTTKRPHNEASTETVSSPNKKQNIQDDSASKAEEKLIKEEVFSPINPFKTEDTTEGETKDAQASPIESPSKNIPQFKLPPELAPFNNPGVCDYGVIRTSRLRNRKKTNAHQDDVLYQNIQGQRRCRATRDGKKMIGQGNTNRCLNCAEGVFKYCHTHRDLDADQRAFWEQRKRRDAQIGSCSSSLRTDMALKKQAQLKPQPAAAAVSRTNLIGQNSRWKCVEAGEAQVNHPRRCVILCDGKGRCSRKMMSTQPGFCYGHTSLAQFMKPEKDEMYRSHAGTMRCTAVSKVGSKCKFKAVNNCVFCAKHIAWPPEKATPMKFVAAENTKKGYSFVDKIKKEASSKGGINAWGVDSSVGEPTKGSSRKRGQNKSLAISSMMPSTHSLITKQSKGKASRLKTIIEKAKGYTKSFQKTTSDSSLAESHEVPKNIEFPRKLDFSNEQLEMATSFDDICFNVYKSKRCWYKRAEGGVLCHKCIVCHEEETPFDHIINGDTGGDESILFSSKCVKFEGGKQCENMAVKGKILCKECIIATKYDYSDCSESSESGSGDSDTDSSSATFSSGSDDSRDSRISDDTNYDTYCMAYTHKEFFNMWKNWEKKTERMDEVEDSRLIKRANNTMSPTDTDGQVKAQYGRVLPHAMKKMIKILELRRKDVFLDIGHGVGNTCLHASFCTGCDSRGIEVVSDRHEIADKFRGGMYAEHNCTDEPRPEVGKVDLRLGRLEDPNQKDFLTKGITRAYVNNFNGVFAERSSKNKDKWFLDDYISGIFASMAPGAIMVTFHPLNLGLDRDSANELRSKHNLDESDHASYYDIEKILLGQAFCSVKWNKRSGNTNKIYVYKYRRLEQPGHHDAVFLCSNPSCKMATNMVPIPATTVNEDGRCVINHCKCKFSPKNLRKRSNNKASP